MNNLWMTPSYTTRTWPYRDLPAVGDSVRYMNDGFDVTVDAIRATRIVLSDGTTYRRRVEWGRIDAWITDHFPTFGTRTVQDRAELPQHRPLRPTTHYVHHVKII